MLTAARNDASGFADDDLGPKNNAGLVRLSCGHRLVIDHFIFCGRLRG
jgi:hypothetical protein